MSTSDVLTDNTTVVNEIERGIAAAQAGDRAGAHKIFQGVAAQNGHLADVWVWLGGTSSTLDESEAAFQRAVMLDPSNEEANLGLRWVALRRQVTGVTEGTDLTTGAFDRGYSTDQLATSALGSGMLGSGNLSSSSLSSGSLRAEDADKAAKMKVGNSAGRRKMPTAALAFFILSLILYGIVLWVLVIEPMLNPK